MPAKTFDEVYSLYKSLGRSQDIPEGMSLNDFSNFAGDVSGEDYSAGHGNWLKQQLQKGSFWVNQGLDAIPGLKEGAGNVGRSIYDFLGGNPERGYEMGKSMPRGLVDFLPTILFPEAKVAKIATSALLGSGTLEETGSVPRAAVSAALPKIMEVGGNALANYFSKLGLIKPAASNVAEETLGGALTGRMIPTEELYDPLSKAAHFAAHQVGALGAAELTNYATEAIANKTWNPYEGQSLYDKFLDVAVGNAPYIGASARHYLNGKPITISRGHPVDIEGMATKPEGVDVSQITDEQAKRTQLMASGVQRVSDVVTQEVKDARRKQFSDALLLHDLGDTSSLVKPNADKTSYWNYDDFPESAQVIKDKVQAKDVDVFHKVYDESGRLVYAGNPDEANRIHAERLAAGKTGVVKQVEVPRISQEELTSITKDKVDDVKSAVDLNKVNNKLEVLKAVSGERTDSKAEVADALIEQGVNPVDATKSATVGAANSALERAKEKMASFEQKKQAKLEEEVSNTNIFTNLNEGAKRGEALHPEPVTDANIKESLTTVQSYSGSDKNAALRTWGKWYDEFLNGKLQKGKEIAALKGRLGARAAREGEQMPQVIEEKREKDPDVRLTKQKVNEDLARIITDLELSEKEQEHLVKMAQAEGYDGIKKFLEKRRAEGAEDELLGSSGRRYAIKTPAGGPFNFKLGSLLKELPTGHISFARRVIDKNGTLAKQVFEAVAAKNVSKEELALWKLLVPKAFEGNRVDVKVIETKLKEIALDKSFDISKLPIKEGFNLFRAKGLGEIEEDTHLPSNEEVLKDTFQRTGFSDEESAAFVETFQKIQKFVGLEHVEVRPLLNDLANEQPVAGLSSASKNIIYLSQAFTKPSGTTAAEMGVVMMHELGHQIKRMSDQGILPEKHKARFDNFMEFAKDSEKSKEFLSLMREGLPESVQKLPIWEELLKADTPDEVFANTVAMWAAQRLPHEEAKALGLVQAPEGRGLLKTLSEYARRFWGSIKGLFYAKPGEAKDFFKSSVNEMVKSLDTLNKAMRDGEFAAKDMLAMARMGSSDLWTLRTSQLIGEDMVRGMSFHPAKFKETDRHEVGLLEGGWNKLLRTMNDIGATVPALNRAVRGAMNMPAESHMNANKAVGALYGGINPETGDVVMNGPSAKLMKLLTRDGNVKANKAVSSLMQWKQSNEAPKGILTKEAFDKADPEWDKQKLKPIVDALPKEVQNAVWSFFENKLPAFNKSLTDNTVESFAESGRYLLMSNVAHSGKVPWKDMPEFVRNLTDGFDLAQSADPNEALLGAKRMEVARQTLGDELFMKTIEQWADTKKVVGQIGEFFDESHASMIRVGKYKVSAFDKNGKTIRTSALNDRANAREWIEKVRGVYGDLSLQLNIEETKRGEHFTLGDETIDFLHQLEQKQNERIDAMELDEDTKQTLKQMGSISGDLAISLNSTDPTIPGFHKTKVRTLGGAGRKIVPGDMDMVATQHIYAKLASRINAGRKLRAQLAFEFQNPELKNFPSEVQQIKDQLHNFSKPDSPLGRKISQLQQFMFLAGNIPANLINLTQSFHSLLPEIVSHIGGVIKSMGIVGRAVKDAAKHGADILWNKETALSKIPDSEQRELLRQAVDKGILQIGTISTLGDVAAETAIDMDRLAISEGKTDKMWKKVTKPIEVFSRLSQKMYSATEHFNQRAALFAGLEVAKQQMGAKYDRQKAFDFSFDMMRNATYAGGRINRPVQQGNWRTFGNMVYGLQSYTVGWINQAMRHLRNWKGAEYLNLTPEQRTNARKASLTMFGTMVAAAGALGMPFVSSALKIAEKATGEDLEGQLYTNLAKLFSDDEEDGGAFARVALNGGANALLANSGLPIDLGQRWAVNGVFGLNPYDGFSGDAVFGPSAQLVGNALSGLKGAVTGDFGKAASALAPSSIKKAMSLWMNDGEVRTSGGQLVPTSGIEKAAYGLGFTPQTVSSLNQFEEYRKSTEAAMELENKRDSVDILNALKGNPEQARDMMQKLATERGESRQQLAERVAKTAAEQAFPKDVRNEMHQRTSQHLGEVAKVLGIQMPLPNNAAKEGYMNELLMQLGVRPKQFNKSPFVKDIQSNEFTPFQKPQRSF